ncbi:hypothetical protein DMENIID0001_136200 [Sergentomyia squamirostris]
MGQDEATKIEEFSCYFDKWMSGSCTFLWDTMTDFSDCGVYFQFGDNLVLDLKIECSIETKMCEIKIDFVSYSPNFSVHICYDTSGFAENDPIVVDRYSVEYTLKVEILCTEGCRRSRSEFNPIYKCIDASMGEKTEKTFRNLIPDRKYRITLCQKYTKAPKEEKFWSSPAVLEFRTKASKPLAVPRTIPGAFHAIDQHNLTIYMQRVDSEQAGGSNFTYKISACQNQNQNQLFLNTEPNKIVSWINEVDGVPSKSLDSIRIPETSTDICIKTENSVGKSELTARMDISILDKPRCRYVISVYSDMLYQIVWSISPLEDFTGFTLFACQANPGTDEQCKSFAVEAVELPRTTYYYIYESKEALRFAVSPIYGDRSPGMTWAVSVKHFPGIVLLDIEPATETSVRIYWACIPSPTSSLGDFSVVLRYRNGTELDYKVTKLDSQLIKETVFRTEILNITDSHITVEKDEDSLYGECCPEVPKFIIIPNISSIVIRLSDSRYKKTVRLKRDDKILREQRDPIFPLLLNYLSNHTKYILEFEFYTNRRSKKYCVKNISQIVWTKSGTPGPISVTNITQTLDAYRIFCTSEFNTNNDTMYEILLYERLNQVPETSSIFRSYNCSFHINIDCIDLIGYDYTLRAVNDGDDAGLWSEKITISRNDLKCYNHEFFTIPIILISVLLLLILIVFILYFFLYKYPQMKEITEDLLKADLPEGLTRSSPSTEDQENLIESNKTESKSEFVDWIPLLEFPQKTDQFEIEKSQKSIQEIEECLRKLMPSLVDEEEENSTDEDGSEVVVSVQIHQEELSDSSEGNDTSDTEDVKEIKEKEQNNIEIMVEVEVSTSTSPYCKLSEVVRKQNLEKSIPGSEMWKTVHGSDREELKAWGNYRKCSMILIWIIGLAAIFHGSVASETSISFENWSCYFWNWMEGNCTFKWDNVSDFAACKVALELGGIHEVQNLNVTCSNITDLCTIPVYYAGFGELGMGYTSVKIRVCFNMVGYADGESFERMSVTKAEPPQQVKLINQTTKSIILEWSDQYKFDTEDIAEVRIISLLDDKFEMIQIHKYNYSRYVEQVTVDQLPYSNQPYKVSLRRRYGMAPDEEKFWSDWSVLEFRTNTSRPMRSPETFPGAFTKTTKHKKTNWIIYWKRLDPIWSGGPNLTYSVSLCDEKEQGLNHSGEPKRSEKISWRNEVDGVPVDQSESLNISRTSSEVCIRSENSIGMSENSSKINLGTTTEPGCRKVWTAFVNKTYHEVVWSISPLVDLTSFTLFACQANPGTDEQCKSFAVEAVELSSTTYYYRYESKEALRFAVSPIYADRSPGMTWAISVKNLPDIVLLDIEPATETSIRIYWALISKPSDNFEYNVTVKYIKYPIVNMNVPDSKYLISKNNSQHLLADNIYTTEIQDITTGALVRVEYNDDFMEEKTCPRISFVTLTPGQQNLDLKFNTAEESTIEIRLNGTMLDTERNLKDYRINNLSSYTNYLVDVDYYTWQKKKRMCNKTESISVLTKSGTPGSVAITESGVDGNKYWIVCAANGNITAGTRYFLAVKKNVNGGSTIHLPKEPPSRSCDFVFEIECNEETIGYEVNLLAENDGSDKGPLLKTVLTKTDFCRKTDYIRTLVIPISLLILIALVAFIVYFVYYKYPEIKKTSEDRLKVDLPKGLTTSPSSAESQENGAVLNKTEDNICEFTESIPLLEFPKRPNQETHYEEIRQSILDVEESLRTRFPSMTTDNDGSTGSSSELMVNAQIHTSPRANSEEDVTTGTTSTPGTTTSVAILDGKFMPPASYCRLSDLAKLPNSAKNATEQNFPAFSGYVMR